MNKKASLFNKLKTSVVTENERARDKFETADIVVALAKVKDERNGPAPVDTTPAPTAARPMADQESTAPTSASATPAQPFVVREIPIELVKDHPRNARHIYDPARIDEMATSIARDGQRVPAVVMPDPDVSGAYLLIEGRYRKKALTSLGRDTILASIIEPLSELEAYRLSLLLNEERNDQTALDNALSWKSMLDAGTYRSQEHIAEHLNLKQGTVSKTLAILDLPANVLAVIRTKPSAFGMRIAQELRQVAKILPEKNVEALAEQVRDEKLSVRDLEKIRERKDREPVTRERSRAYPLQWGSSELGSVREFDDGRLKIDLSNAPDELRGKIIDAVKKVLTETAPSRSSE
jgi:ParB family chromosome partitioning protein